MGATPVRRSTWSPSRSRRWGRSPRARSCAAAPTRGRRGRASPSSAGTRSTTPSRSTGSRSPAWPTPTPSSPTPAARAGDALVLTKPLGAGTVATAIKRGLAGRRAGDAGGRGDDDAQRPRRGGRRARPARTRSPTSPASACWATCTSWPRPAGWRPRSTPPRCPRSTACSSCSPTTGALAGGSRRNRADAEQFTTLAPGVPEPRRRLVCDAMTSGGLLAAVPRAGRRMQGWVVGRLAPGRARHDHRRLALRQAGPAESPSRLATTPAGEAGEPAGSTEISGSSTSTIAIAARRGCRRRSSSPRRSASRSRIAHAREQRQRGRVAAHVPPVRVGAEHERRAADAADEEHERAAPTRRGGAPAASRTGRSRSSARTRSR